MKKKQISGYHTFSCRDLDKGISDVLVRSGLNVLQTSGCILIVLVLSCSVVSDILQPHGLILADSSVHGIFQARILEWVAISFSKESILGGGICWIYYEV